MSQFEVFNPYHSQGLAAGGSALLDAINKGKIHLAKFILDAGEYDIVNTRDFKGKTPLIRACYIKEEKTRDRAMQLLLNKAANVNLRDEVGRTALSYACEMRCNDIVKILVKNNVNPDIPDILGSTPLIYSARVGNDTAIEILIRSFRRLGLNVDHVNNEGLTALLTAAKNGFIGCAALLAIDGRADLNLRDPETGMNAEELGRTRGCSNAEVLPFSPSANPGHLRLSRCGSLLTTAAAAARTTPSSSSGREEEEGVDAAASRGAWRKVSLTTSPLEPIASRQRAAEEAGDSTSGAALCCPLPPPGSDQRRKGSRRRRHSAPEMHLAESAKDSADLVFFFDRATTIAATPAPLEIRAPGGVRCWCKTDPVASGSSVSRAALGHRKSRELVRADTDVTRCEAFVDDDDDD